MKHIAWLALTLLLLSCDSQAQAPSTSFLIDGTTAYTLETNSSTPAALAARIGLSLSPADRFILNGKLIPADLPLPGGLSYTLQILRAVNVTLRTPEGETTFPSAALTLGQALTERGLTLSTADFLSPSPETPLTTDLTVIYRPARNYTIRVDGQIISIKSSATTVGQILASAGTPLLGLDYSLPPESAPAPADGIIEIVRVQETLTIISTPIPFNTRYQDTADLPLGSENLLQAGETGLKITTLRIRYENGSEVSRLLEKEQIVRQPKEQIVGRGTQITLQTLQIPGGQIQYWRAVQMYATSYSPCRSGGSQCSYGTASGLPVQRGVVAMTRDLFNALRGTQVYVPGYGIATIGDVGGGFPDGRLWIDLAYSDADWQNWSGWVTVYFLAPAPAYIPERLR
ncbi:MAG: hypothetical protein DDG60_09670 [Anaerolineae bacterium]|nr:MAG: hypothetical protein DDG60_09670 [Anaerolineae bacterium]